LTRLWGGDERVGRRGAKRGGRRTRKKRPYAMGVQGVRKLPVWGERHNKGGEDEDREERKKGGKGREKEVALEKTK